ncbi:MAG TPA: DUF192 domain-containing protein [Patescibacteria group bacterium]
MKKLFLVFGLLIVIIAFMFIMQNKKYANIFAVSSSHQSTISIDNHTFTLLIAKTEKEKETGLSGRSELPETTGMIFPFDTPGLYAFWMKDMKFPLDIIYIHGNKIVTIINSLPNPTPQNDTWQIVKPTEAADFVLEINAGLSKKYNFQVGDMVKLSL